ncbi:hypothetical protein Tco_0994157, partial [Tanacetum coccineum]
MCQTDVLRKRPHDDHDLDHHEVENAKKQKTIEETSSTQEPSSGQQQDEVDDAYELEEGEIPAEAPLKSVYGIIEEAIRSTSYD